MSHPSAVFECSGCVTVHFARILATEFCTNTHPESHGKETSRASNGIKRRNRIDWVADFLIQYIRSRMKTKR